MSLTRSRIRLAAWLTERQVSDDCTIHIFVVLSGLFWAALGKILEGYGNNPTDKEITKAMKLFSISVACSLVAIVMYINA